MYNPVPPDPVAVNVSDCPTFNIEVWGEIVGFPSGGLTVTVTGREVAVIVGVIPDNIPVSVIITSYVCKPGVVGVTL